LGDRVLAGSGVSEQLVDGRHDGRLADLLSGAKARFLRGIVDGSISDVCRPVAMRRGCRRSSSVGSEPDDAQPFDSLERLRSLIADGIDSGGGRRLTDALVQDLRRRALESVE
jgi:hypothetical protein